VSFPVVLRVRPPRLWMWPGEILLALRKGLDWL
jgi:hypothetical protein